MQNNKFETSIVNLASLQNYNFSIPTYQRPYVWQDEQVKKILDDFYKSYQQDKDNTYFIGTILTKEQSNEAELIDGQQRFTTLWLIAFIISRVCKKSKITHFLRNKEGELRLGFEIRGEIKDFLEALLNENDFQKEKFNEEFIEHYPYLKNIAKRLAFIKGYIDQMPATEIETFGNFIYDKVYLVKNVTPQKTDLNKLFSTINSAGVQLEQTDIIKANLLKRIDEKVLYGKIWETCENTNNFFERNARISFPKTDWYKINLEHYVEFNPAIFKYEDIIPQNANDKDNFTIDDINIDTLKEYHQPNKIIADEKRESEEIYCRSIINFGQLLLHAYRLHLKKEGKEDFAGTFHVNRLITIFKDLEDRNDTDEIKRFFLLLWKVRYLFDKYIIKWISDIDNKTESLELVNFNRNEQSYYSRSKYAQKSPSLMLQSVLYFTGDYLRQFWLTSYLGYLLENHNNSDATDKKHLEFLEKMDNSFSLNDNLTDKEASWILINEDIIHVFKIEKYLNQSLGTGFKHYWFQKLEYILWKNWAFEKTEEFNNFKILSKNSVEHIYPQNPANVQKSPHLEDDFLHAYGNLVLLSVSQNSEYSRKSFDEKKGLFNDKNVYDTLKSYYIFQKDKWGKDEITVHCEEMISKIKAHYGLNIAFEPLE